MNFRFSISKDDEKNLFKFNLDLLLVVDEFEEDFEIFADAVMPVSPCNSNQDYVLPGDGTITGFVDAIGPTIGNTAVELVLTKLGVTVRC